MLVSVDTIYVDSLFALNLAADYLMLLCGARISGAVIRRGRLLIAAVVGAAVYKEKLTVKSTVGILLGVVSMIVIKAL